MKRIPEEILEVAGKAVAQQFLASGFYTIEVGVLALIPKIDSSSQEWDALMAAQDFVEAELDRVEATEKQKEVAACVHKLVVCLRMDIAEVMIELPQVVGQLFMLSRPA